VRIICLRRTGSRNDRGKETALLDAMRREMGWSSDGVMAEELDVFRSVLSKIRHGTNQVSAEMILKVHKRTGWPVERIEFLCVPQVPS